MSAIPTTVANPIVLDLSASYGALIIAAYISCALWGINVMQRRLMAREDIGRLTSVRSPKYRPRLPLDRYSHSRIVNTAHKILVTKLTFIPREALHEAWVGSLLPPAMLVVGGSGSSSPCFLLFLSHKSRLKRAGLVVATVVDVFIAVAMVLLLKDTDSADGRVFRPQRTSRTIRRLTVIVVNTDLFTAVVAMICLILDETASGTVFWTAIVQYPQCSIYLSAFLTNLNARHYIRGGDGSMTISNIEDLCFATSAWQRLAIQKEAWIAGRTHVASSWVKWVLVPPRMDSTVWKCLMARSSPISH
ncbi:hypothetical protein C8R43DRAFT_940701 [Mycena crocata]|nr:hypothetical protein C8R43DRAFT_940701 [Mycena crocata]